MRFSHHGEKYVSVWILSKEGGGGSFLNQNFLRHFFLLNLGKFSGRGGKDPSPNLLSNFSAGAWTFQEKESLLVSRGGRW